MTTKYIDLIHQPFEFPQEEFNLNSNQELKFHGLDLMQLIEEHGTSLKLIIYKKLTTEILNLLIEEYPLGIDSTDIFTFKNSNNETIEAVEVRTEDTIYLVKVGIKLDKAMQSFIDDDYEFDMDINFNNY